LEQAAKEEKLSSSTNTLQEESENSNRTRSLQSSIAYRKRNGYGTIDSHHITQWRVNTATQDDPSQVQSTQPLCLTACYLPAEKEYL
jgi:hypothetical protein